MELFLNRVFATLAAGIDDTTTTLPLTAGHGARFGTIGAGNKVRIVFLDAAANVSEIAYMTAISSDTATIERAQDGSTAVAHLAGERIECRIGKSTLESLLQLLSKDASGGYAGLTLFKINFKNSANTFTNFLTNATTAARTWTFPDKNGTVAMTSDITGFAATGANTDITSMSALTAITTTAGVDIKGTNTNDSAAAGDVGEFVSSSASGVALTNATAANITSISLTAGDWDICAKGAFSGNAATTVSLAGASISPTSATISDDGIGSYTQIIARSDSLSLGNGNAMGAPFRRVSLASTTTYYLVVQLNFSVSTATGSGGITARRVR